MTGRSDGGGDCGGNSPNVKINEESFAETCKKTSRRPFSDFDFEV
jgi:hypothetical protein